MIVVKFGGTSLSSPLTLLTCLDIIAAHLEKGHRVGVVVSALGGITDFLVCSIDQLLKRTAPETLITSFREKHNSIFHDSPIASIISMDSILDTYCNKLRSDYDRIIKDGWCSLDSYCSILSTGELISSAFMYQLLSAKNISTLQLDPQQMIMTQGSRFEAEPVLSVIKDQFLKVAALSISCFLMAGFIGGTRTGQLSLLGRNSSDFSGSLMCLGFHAKHYEIWTDVDGIFNENPKETIYAQSIPHLTYDEACSDKFIKAKVLHYKTLPIIRQLKTNVYIKNTFNPLHPGTKISCP